MGLNLSSTTTSKLYSSRSLGPSFLKCRRSLLATTFTGERCRDYMSSETSSGLDTLAEDEDNRQWPPLVVNRTPGGRPGFQEREGVSPAPFQARAQPPPGCAPERYRIT